MAKRKRAKRKRPTARKPRYSRFLFRATGEETSPRKFTVIDLYDNAIVELDRLRAVGVLMTDPPDDLDREVATGVAGIIGDCEERMRELLRLAQEAGRVPRRKKA